MAQSALYAFGVIRSCLWEKTLWDSSRLPSHKETAVRSGLWRSWWRVDLSSGSLDLGSRLLSTTYRVPTFGSVSSVHSSGCRYCQCQATDLTGCTSCCLALTPPVHCGWESFDLDNRNSLAEPMASGYIESFWLCDICLWWGPGEALLFLFSFREWLVGHPPGALLPGPPDISVGL